MVERPLSMREVGGSMPPDSRDDARVAQSVERKALNLVVEGSSPSSGTICFLLCPPTALFVATSKVSPTDSRHTLVKVV